MHETHPSRVRSLIAVGLESQVLNAVAGLQSTRGWVVLLKLSASRPLLFPPKANLNH